MGANGEAGAWHYAHHMWHPGLDHAEPQLAEPSSPKSGAAGEVVTDSKLEDADSIIKSMASLCNKGNP